MKNSNAQTKYNESVKNVVRQFTDCTDDNVESWLLFLLQGWMSSDAVEHTDASMREDMMRAFIQTINLVNGITAANKENYATNPRINDIDAVMRVLHNRQLQQPGCDN